MTHQDFGVNQALVEEQYRRYREHPQAVDSEWRVFFDGLSPEEQHRLADAAAGAGGPQGGAGSGEVERTRQAELAWRCSRMVTAFRSRGHVYAKVDPLHLSGASALDWTLEDFGISNADMHVEVQTDVRGMERTTPAALYERMRTLYCGSAGVELMQVEDDQERQWLLDNWEEPAERHALRADQLQWILRRLTDAEQLEAFLHQQYLGAKRFSLEGLESFIPMLHHMLDLAAAEGVRHAVIGMAHRGRLNVLVNILQKGLSDLFLAFNDSEAERNIGRGDVKYHLGYRTQHEGHLGGAVDVALCFNPSHLEFVNPVVMGRVRAILDREGAADGAVALPICVHGDAAFIGQGIVTETLNLAELQGYRVGGTVHIVLNNQVGFTTSPGDSRSSRYATDAMTFLRVPVFHVNAEDVDEVLRVADLAIRYRQRFGRDVCIDLVGYRRYGHNEGDEPRFTQPLMYEVIDQRPSLRNMVAENLVERGVISAGEAESMIQERRERMLRALQESRAEGRTATMVPAGPLWTGYVGGDEDVTMDIDTRVSLERLQGWLDRLTSLPPTVHAHPKLAKLFEQRRKALDPDQPFDWGVGEALAYASLVAEGHPVRLTGQDARRGTFSHRHAYVVDTRTGARWTPYSLVEQRRALFQVYDSPLSEAACLGFEYGYSLEAPQALVLWEAQFGDFVNGAQVIVDQFIASGEDKWGRLTGLTMLLPHGFEGQGPEHSYARLGRFLQLCAEDNMQVCDCTTPAQFFHLLRRQLLRPWRKPLVVMTPKSLLRHKGAVSTLRDLEQGTFQRVIEDQGGAPAARARRVLLCSGRIYYDLIDERAKRGADDVHVIRFEQLYPLQSDVVARALRPYRAGTQLVWVQDEPWNMGAWYFIKARLTAMFGDGLPLQCVARAESASPATGSPAAHRYENAQLLEAAFAR